MMEEGSKKGGWRMQKAEKTWVEQWSPLVFVKEPAKKGEQLKKEVEFWEFVVEKLITMDWEIKKMRKGNEGLWKEVVGLRKEIAEMHGWMGEVIQWMKNQVKDLALEVGGMEVEEGSESSTESDTEMVSAVDKEKGVCSGQGEGGGKGTGGVGGIRVGLGVELGV